MTNDEDVITVAGKTCEFVLCYDDRERGTGKWLLSKLFWAVGGELKGVEPICDCGSVEVGMKEINKLLSYGH